MPAGTSISSVSSSATTSAVRVLPVSAAISPITSPAPMLASDRYPPLSVAAPTASSPDMMK